MTTAPDLAGRASSDRVSDDGPPAHPAGHQLAPGYQVIEHVRRGEDLDSYEAWSSQRYCRCFIKTLRPDFTSDAAARRHLQREARLLLSLTHPHLVRAYEYVKPDSAQAPLLILENLTGATLSYLLSGSRRRLGTQDLGHLGRHLCSALRYLHSCGHLHLDVKPSNIIACDGVARLIDLSLARPPGRCSAGLGTPGYMSPEQVTGGVLGPPADVWGIGLVLYQGATGLQPFDIPGDSASGSVNTSTLSLCRTQLARPAPRVRARRRLPADVADVIDACLRRDPDQRPTLESLDAALATLTG
ncbi:MAG: serine/threonine protein kinase [Pseudonocardiales bacterium]|nr:serine/threonine protein kinase [Actinomycetota bacterium]PZS17060.1 MAG: serine/threonine protein kinase [Pseudonocardiales bacterium]